MKGILLAEFVEYLEINLGEETAQKIIDDSNLESQGAYSRVGFYDYQELLSLLTQAVKETKLDANEVLTDFCFHVFKTLKEDYSFFFEGVNEAAEMLIRLDDHIHVEVQKLYPDAELPKFTYTKEGKVITLNYSSPRPMALVAKGMLEACLLMFDGREKLSEYTIADDHKSATFIVQTVN